MSYTKLYILAKELGVKSTAIIKKCQEEGLENVKTHMAPISAGLAATIREWFSEGDHVTTEETTEKVDLQKVRIKKKKVTEAPQIAPEIPKAEAEAASPQPPVAAVTIEPPPASVEEKPTITPSEPIVTQPQIHQAAAAQGGAATVETQAPVKEIVEEQILKAPVAATQAPPKKPAKAKPIKKPQPIKPAGPRLEKPKPAKLTGPTIVRVEVPEAPPRLKPKPRYDTTQPLIDETINEGLLAIKGKKVILEKHLRHKERGHHETPEELLTDASKKAKYLTMRRQRDIRGKTGTP